MQWAIDHYDKHGAYNLGVYNCRSVRGASTTSCHGEGRALDVGFPMAPDGTGTPVGHEFVERLRCAGESLGIQCMIYDRRIWSAKSPGPMGRHYTGESPHFNHVHVELSRDAARWLRYRTVALALDSDPTPRPPTPVQFESYDHHAQPGQRTLKVGSAGDDVKFVQRFIGSQRCGSADGYFSRKTKAGVTWYQDMRALRPDGIVAERTWAQILGSEPARRRQG